MAADCGIGIDQIETWIKETHYSGARKRAQAGLASRLFGAYHPDAISDFLRAMRVECFIKDEPYSPDDQRFRPRLIVSRPDMSKNILGPFFKPIEIAFFNLP